MEAHELGEKVAPEVKEDPLPHPLDEVGLAVGGGEVDRAHGEEAQADPKEEVEALGKGPGLRGHQGQVNGPLEEEGGGGGGQGDHQEEKEGEDDLEAVGPDVAQDAGEEGPVKGLAVGVLRHASTSFCRRSISA